MSQPSIKAALTRHGPMTAAQLGARTGLGSSTVSTQIKAIRDKHEAHIHDWVVLATGKPGRSAPIYALGDAPDAVCKSRNKRLVNAKPAPVIKASEYAEVRRQAGMWGGLLCNA